MKMIQLTQSQAEGFYAIHKERPFFKDLVKFMISGPVVVQVLERCKCSIKNRDIMGATNPAQMQLLEQFVENSHQVLMQIAFMVLTR